MNKRNFLKLSMTTAAFVGLNSEKAGAKYSETIEVDGVIFTWQMENGALIGNLKAPTTGWIAAGFNKTAALQNTYFLMASVSQTPIRVEEHLALVPNHRRIDTLGLPSALQSASGYSDSRHSHLSFALTPKLPNQPDFNLARNAKIGLMLAWSHETNFDHHSAWRRHFAITL